MKIAICDDISECVSELKHKIADICAKEDWPLESTIFTSASAIIEADLLSTQVVFLDIDMPEKDGLEVAKALREKYPDIIIVFVTAFIEYAPAGYNVSAFRYLLKQKIDSDLPSIMNAIKVKLYENTDCIDIEQKTETITLPVRNILYLEGTPYRMVLFHVSSSKEPISASGKLIDYEQMLSGKGFLRLQKSFVANMSYISRISNYQVLMKNGITLNASEKYYKQVQSSFLQWKGQHI